MAIGSYDGSIRIDTRIDEKGFNSGISSMMAGVKRLAIAIGAIFGAKLAAQAAAGVVKLAAEFQRLELAALAVGRMFGFTGDQVRALVGDLVDMGIQSDVANKAFINFAREGLDTALLPALARGAQDLNVFAEAGATSSDVLDRLLNGILTLQPEVLRTAGVPVDLNQAYRQMAAAQGIATEQLTIQEKRQAALIAVTEKLTGVTGLYEISQQTLAGQLASNTRIVNQFKAALGGPFTGAVFTVVKAWNDLLKAFTAAIGPGGRLHGLFLNLAAAAQLLGNMIARVIQAVGALFGVKIELAAQTTQSMASATGALADATGAAADAQGDLAKETGKAAKAAKGALAPFDELNVLQQDTPTGGAGAGGGAAGGGFPIVEPETGPITKALDEIGKRVEELKKKFLAFFEPLREPFNRLKAAILELGGKIWDGLKWAWDNILVPLGRWAVNEALPRFLELLAAGIEVLNDVIDALKPLGIWLWENFLKPAAEWVGDKIIEALEWLTERLEGLSDWIKENQTVVEIIAIVLGSFVVALLLVAGAMALVTLVGGALAAVFAFLSSPIVIVALVIGALIAIIILLIRHWDWVSEAGGKAWDWIVKKWKDAGAWFKKTVTEPVKKWFKDQWDKIKKGAALTWGDIVKAWQGAKAWFQNNVTNPIKSFFSSAWSAIESKVGNVWTGIKTTWLAAKGWFQTNVTDPVRSFFASSWSAIESKVGNVWTAVKNIWKNAKDWFQTTVIDPVKSAFDTALTTIEGYFETAFNGIKTKVIAALNTVIDKLNAMISGAGSAINGLIGAINAIKITIPKLLGGGTIGFNISKISVPQIPKLATGAVIPANASFLAMLGDQRSGRNIEAPESLLRQIVREEMGNIEADITVKFEGNLAQLVRQLKPVIDRENVRVGRSLIKSGATT